MRFILRRLNNFRIYIHIYVALDIVAEKVEHVKQEIRCDIVEGDRRRTSMLVEGVVSPKLYLGALADFLLEIAKTMEKDLRPPRPGARQGQLIKFSEGILCQQNNVYPGLEAKCSTGSENYSGWYAAILAVVRRMVQFKNDWAHDQATTMSKCTINFDRTDRPKTIVFMTALKEHMATVASNYVNNRQTVHSGRLVEEFINESAAILKRLFVPRTEDRIEKALDLETDPIENHRCFDDLRTEEDRAVLRFCKCEGRYHYLICELQKDY